MLKNLREKIKRVFSLRPGESNLVLILGVILLCNSIAVQISGIVSISNFLSAGGVNNFLIVWFIDDIVILLMAGLQTLIVDRFNRIALMKGLTFGFGMVFLVLRLMFTFGMPDWLNYGLLYLLSEQQELFIPLIFWIMANDMLDVSQTKRLFPLIATLNFIGKLIGIGIAAFSPAWFARIHVRQEEVLLINILLYLISYMVISSGLSGRKIRQTQQKPEKVRETLLEGWGFIKEVPAYRFLTLAVLAISLCEISIGFHFYVVSDKIFTEPDVYQQFLSIYRLATITIMLLIQSFVTSRVINKISLKNSFLIMPFAVLAGSAWLLAAPGIISVTGALVLMRLTGQTIDESTKKSFLALVPEERRGRVSMFMDSYLPAGGTALSVLVVLLIVVIGTLLKSTNYYYVYLALGVAASAFSVWSIFRMRKVYDSSLFNWRLKRRQRGSSVLDKLEF